MSDLVSIIMPCFNGEKYIAESIESVLIQTYSNFQLIVVDDHSSDSSLEIANRYARQDFRVSVFLNPGEKGAAAARNYALSRSTGRYIAFLDCDDLWFPNKLEYTIDHLKRYDLAFTWSAYRIIDESANFLRLQSVKGVASIEDILKKAEVIGCLTVVYDAVKLGKIEMPLIKMRNDYALWMSILRRCENQGLKYSGITKSLASFRSHPSSLTSNKFSAAYFQWKFLRNHSGASLIKSIYFMGCYFFNAVKDRFQVPGD